MARTTLAHKLTNNSDSQFRDCISNNPVSRLKHLGVSDGSNGSDGMSYPLTENYTHSIALRTYLLYFAPLMR
jgi:hypothetical protein